MYTSIFIYPVPNQNVDKFIDIQKEAAALYKEYGALDDETFEPVDLEAKYGCLAFNNIHGIKSDEKLFVSLSRFNDRAHHDHVMAQVDADERINELYDKVTAIVDLSRIRRGEFERIV